MKTLVLAVAIVAGTLTGCAGLSERDQRIGSGAVIGGAIGSAVGGGTAGTIGGAVLGGVIGNQVDQNKRLKDQQRDIEERNQRERDAYNRRYNDCRRYNSQRYCDHNVR